MEIEDADSLIKPVRAVQSVNTELALGRKVGQTYSNLHCRPLQAFFIALVAVEKIKRDLRAVEVPTNYTFGPCKT